MWVVCVCPGFSQKPDSYNIYSNSAKERGVNEKVSQATDKSDSNWWRLLLYHKIFDYIWKIQ